MRRVLLALSCCLPLPALALDLEAISRGLVEAGPWGQNAEFLPWLLAWLGITLLLAVAAKLLYTAIDHWRTDHQARELAHQHADQWIMEVGELLNVRAPRGLKPGETPAEWHKYRHQVKLALTSELQRSRQLAAQVFDLQRR